MSDPDTQSWLSSLVAGLGAAVAALGTWAWRHTHKLIGDKADMKSLDALTKRVEDHAITRDAFDQHTKSDEQQLGAIDKELGMQRGHIAKLFDKLEELGDKTEVRFAVMEKAGFERHVELLNAIHSINSTNGHK